MNDLNTFFATKTGKAFLVLVLIGGGIFLGSHKWSPKIAPVAVAPAQEQIVPVDSPAAANEIVPAQKTTVAPKQASPAPTSSPITPAAPTPTPAASPAPVSSKPTRIDGLANIAASGGLQGNWDADAENDGPVIDVVYQDNQGNIIMDDATESMPITADVKLYAASNALATPSTLVYSGHFDTNQIIFGSIYPRIRIPEEKITLNSGANYKYGKAVVTIHTPEQGDFSGVNNLVVLY